MNKKDRVSFIVSNLAQVDLLFHNIISASSATSKEKRTNIARYSILKFLQISGEHFLTDICNCVHYKKNTLSELLDRMQSDGLVTRKSDTRDRRKTDFTITAAGIRAIKTFEREFVRVLNDYLATLPAQMRDDFLGCLGSLVRISKSCLEQETVDKLNKIKSR